MQWALQCTCQVFVKDHAVVLTAQCPRWGHGFRS